ncbi:MAG: Acetyl-coenzyme A carboxylase carboxyl transferase subunit alpha [Chlamydiae bacterium]|nr:Acetyl-coenzyme A carboxylase carboxyl transferase subunit alpha [Chlamydiota bacterium]
MSTLPHERQIKDYEKMILQLKKQSQSKHSLWSENELQRLGKKLELLKKKVYSDLSPWERVAICRHPSRPHTIDYIKNMCEDFVELCGDRSFGDDHAVIGGLATIAGKKVMLIGQEKGNDTDSRIYRNFGMVHPEGFKKALRLMKMAEKFNLPIVSLIDTPGAFCGLAAEERGQGLVIAENIYEMSQIKTPIIVLIIGEGCSGGALAMAVGDVVGMLEHAYYSVISPEGCASILWKDAQKNAEAATTLKMNSENLLEFNIVDSIIKEPLGGAHHDPQYIYDGVQKFIVEELKRLKNISSDMLLESRYCKYRKIGRVSNKQEITEKNEEPCEAGVRK